MKHVLLILLCLPLTAACGDDDHAATATDEAANPPESEPPTVAEGIRISGLATASASATGCWVPYVRGKSLVIALSGSERDSCAAESPDARAPRAEIFLDGFDQEAPERLSAGTFDCEVAFHTPDGEHYGMDGQCIVTIEGESAQISLRSMESQWDDVPTFSGTATASVSTAASPAYCAVNPSSPLPNCRH